MVYLLPDDLTITATSRTNQTFYTGNTKHVYHADNLSPACVTNLLDNL